MTRSRLLLALLAWALAPSVAAPQSAPAEGDEPESPAALLGVTGPAGSADGVAPSLSAEKIEEVADGVLELSGYADIEYGLLRLQADRIVYDMRSKVAEADGNVILIQGEGTLGASRMVMHLDTGAATLWNVTGYTPPYYQFRAARLERVDAERFWIYDAVFTTCTQPVPYWSFKVRQGRVRMEHYAHLRGVAFKTGKMPILYLPYLLWPVKRDRATGLLLPQIGASNERGTYVGNAFFWAMRRNMDATLFLDHYSRAGAAGGLEYRYGPHERGRGEFTGYYLPSDVDLAESERYLLNYRANQELGEAWSMLADVNVVSDAEFYQDFERDFGRAVSAQELSNFDVTRAWSYYAFNVRAERRKQFFTSGAEIVQRRLPEVEVRARGQRLGESPLYLSFNGSANSLRREEEGLDADYGRLDAGFTLSASLAPFSWLDVTPTLTARDTYYTQQEDAGAADGVADEPLRRDLASFGLELLGPKLYRLFEPAPGSAGARFKSTIEPRLIYTYVTKFDAADDILLYDEIDAVPADLNTLTLSLTSRLLRRRALAPDEAAPGEAASGEAAPDEATPDVAAPAEMEYDSASEIASVEIRQTRAFNRDLTLSVADPSLGTPAGPISLLARYNPSVGISADVRVDYDALLHDIRTYSVSASGTSPRLGRAFVSYYAARQLEPLPDATTGELVQGDDTGTLRVGGASAFWRKKISFDLDFSYDLTVDAVNSQRYRVGYQSQCCGFQVEYLQREFGGLLGPTQEFRFIVSLQGVGTFLDLNSRLN